MQNPQGELLEKSTEEQQSDRIRTLETMVLAQQAERVEMEHTLSESQATLACIYRSHIWRVASIYYRVRDYLLPHKTKRRLFVSLFLHTISNLTGVFHGLSRANIKKAIHYFRVSDLLSFEKRVLRSLRATRSDRAKERSFAAPYNYDHGHGKDYVPDACLDLSKKPVIKLVAYYLPQFHPIPENDLWWGKGFTEWTNVTKTVPWFQGHDQPKLPGEFGFYDLRVSEVQKQQIALAQRYGLYGFCFYFYWFGGKRLLQMPLDLFLADRSCDFPFCLSWANENWTRRWNGGDREILIAQDHSPEDDLAFIEAVSAYFRNSRYIRIGEKPMLIVYRPALIPDPRKTAERWRTWCQKNGIGEIYLALTHAFDKMDPREIGFDAAIEFPPALFPLRDITDQYDVPRSYGGQILNYRDALAHAREYIPPPYRKFRGICPGWDNTARRGANSIVLAPTHPDLYKEWLAVLCEQTQRHFAPEERFVFINAWNEWAEGAYLEPDRKYGYAYLRKTAEALAELGERCNV